MDADLLPGLALAEPISGHTRSRLGHRTPMSVTTLATSTSASLEGNTYSATRGNPYA